MLGTLPKGNGLRAPISIYANRRGSPAADDAGMPSCRYLAMLKIMLYAIVKSLSASSTLLEPTLDEEIELIQNKIKRLEQEIAIPKDRRRR
jgi:hypothetical protein